MKKIVFRVDSGTHMGIGHVMRCLTLAIELKPFAQISFITKNHLGFNKEIISSKFPLIVLDGGISKALSDQEKSDYQNWLGEDWQNDLEKTNDVLLQIKDVDMVVVDHYALDEKYEKGLVTKYVMVIDDLMNRFHSCDIILDQNISAVEPIYSQLMKKKSILMMGPTFSLLREEFRNQHPLIKIGSAERKISKILVFFGASDINGDCLKFAKANLAEQSKYFQFTFVLISDHPDYASMEKLTSQYPGVRLLSFVQNFMELMAESDLFIGAGGTTSWERSCLGMASALLTVADNQILVCEELSRQGICHYLGASSAMTTQKWKIFFEEIVPDHTLWFNYREKAYNLVDGLGVLRVSNEIKKLIH